MPKVKIDLDRMGLGSVLIDGYDISDVCDGVMIETSAGTETTVLIRLKPIAVAIEGEYEEIVTDDDPFDI